jgi:gamma-glutamyltranspeptidase/glutathione hydrolase
MYHLDTEGNVIEGKSIISSLRNSWYTGRIIQVHKIRFLPIAEILAPVIALAENGVTEPSTKQLTTEKLL